MNHPATIDAEEQGQMIGRVGIRTYPAGTLARVSALLADGEKDRAWDILMASELECESRNLIMQAPNVGKDLIIQRLLSVNTYSLNLAYGEIGTGTTAPAVTDTVLQTPVARVPVAVTQNIANNKGVLQFFFPDNTLTNSTYTEFGMWVDGTASIGTGQLFNHALYGSPYTKAAGTDITAQATITLT